MVSASVAVRSAICFVGFWLAASVAQADTLWLSNGDRVTGELVRVSGANVTWKSDIFGEITVSQIKVTGIETEGRFEVVVNKDNYSYCRLIVVEDKQQFDCEEESRSAGWSMVSSVAVKAEPEVKAWDLKGSVSAALKDSGGNTEQEQVSIDSRLVASYGVTRQTLALDYDFERKDEVKTKDKRKINYQYDLFLSERWYIGAGFGWEQNRFKDLDSKVTLGVGAGYQFLDTPLMKLSTEAGMIQVEENFIVDDDRELTAFLWKLNYDWIIGSSGLEFFHRHSYQLSMEDSQDWEIDTESGFKLPMIGSLRSEFKLEYDYDNTPAEGAESFDRVWSVGVVYDW